ncbi:ABC transporter permease [Brachybacterium saurashtrense]|uniref:ABC transporter permease n=1 Tax=Brachybacterium saurashtrense TaxID=556288 RepID=A0A345YKH9_9MICO|nr:ABC transporter permease [Brachybacterium saurashtrense]AXK44431.1 ABC transporter permease [Brachybacterium saurashtrense]RRR23043.1 ABC transporter permease [Brachybacterium saurashtrense]
MIKYILRRFVNYLILTGVATVFSYIAASLFFFPRRRYLGINPPIPEESIDGILSAYGVNDKDPVLLRTWWWIERILFEPLSQKLGQDLQGNWVIPEIMSRAGISLRLLLLGALLGAVLGVTLGVWGAVRQYKASDQVVTYASFVLISTPTFVGGVILMIVATNFNELLGFQAIRFTGAYTAGITGFFPQLWDALVHLLLPTIALALFGAAGYSRYQRSLMLDVLGSDFIRTARAKGATRNHALVKHGVRVALIPMSTYFAYNFGTLVAGSAFLEIVFSWSGMGQYGIVAVQTSDVNALAGNVCFTAILLLFSSTLSEVLYAALDPRVRV